MMTGIPPHRETIAVLVVAERRVNVWSQLKKKQLSYPFQLVLRDSQNIGYHQNRLQRQLETTSAVRIAQIASMIPEVPELCTEAWPKGQWLASI